MHEIIANQTHTNSAVNPYLYSSPYASGGDSTPTMVRGRNLGMCIFA